MVGSLFHGISMDLLIFTWNFFCLTSSSCPDHCLRHLLVAFGGLGGFEEVALPAAQF